MDKKHKEIDNIHLRLREIEKTLGVKKNEIAEKAGINRNFYYSAALGRQSISFDFLIRICTVYNIDVNWLIFGEGEMFRQNSEPIPSVDPEIEREAEILSSSDKDIRKIYINMIEAMMSLPKSEQLEIVKNMNQTLKLIIKDREN